MCRVVASDIRSARDPIGPSLRISTYMSSICQTREASRLSFSVVHSGYEFQPLASYLGKRNAVLQSSVRRFLDRQTYIIARSASAVMSRQLACSCHSFACKSGPSSLVGTCLCCARLGRTRTYRSL